MVTRYPLYVSDGTRMRDALDRLFGEPVFRSVDTGSRPKGSSLLPVDVFGTDQDIFVFASAPGIDPAAIEVSIDENVLTIAGSIANVAKSTEADGATWFLHELPHGAFRRSLTLPVDVDVDAVEATFENGILRLRLPKAEAAKPRQIKVRAAQPLDAEPAIEESVGA